MSLGERQEGPLGWRNSSGKRKQQTQSRLGGVGIGEEAHRCPIAKETEVLVFIS